MKTSYDSKFNQYILNLDINELNIIQSSLTDKYNKYEEYLLNVKDSKELSEYFIQLMTDVDDINRQIKNLLKNNS